MALRFLLVSLVSCMGFEIPSGADVAAWSRSGREWAVARVSDLSGHSIEADRAMTGVTGCDGDAGPTTPLAAVPELSATADLGFEAVSEQLSADFAADLAQLRADDDAHAAEAVSIAGLDGPSFLPQGEEVATSPAEVATSPAEAELPVEVAAEPGSIASKSEQFSNAVRLTRDAVQAWAALIEPAEDAATR